ncbi:GNAT family N-acetyltransferase [Actinopolymorpha sp. B11F2]|uniref:GNAT family N-acetyltransferase n=1 Tax=Actinopolymorpha sp. B11F2 TaxID=3160862 RepID=UPI0032E4DFBA
MAASLSPVQLAEAHVRALFRTTGDGLLAETNETPPAKAPRVFVARSRAGTLCHPRHDLHPALAAELRRRARDLPPLSDPTPDPEIYAALRSAVEEDGPITNRWHGPAYAFDGPALEPHPDVVEIREERDLFVGHPFEDFRTDLDHHRPLFAVVRDGRIVAAGFSSRTTEREAEAGVNTHVDHRGQGLGAAVVNAWRLAIEGSGRVPLYSTSYDNLSSQAVTRRLGLRQYAESYWLA